MNTGVHRVCVQSRTHQHDIGSAHRYGAQMKKDANLGETTDYLLPFPSSLESLCSFLQSDCSKLSPLLLQMCSHVTRISGLLPTVHTANLLLVPKPGADFTWWHHIAHIPEWNTWQSTTANDTGNFWLCSKLSGKTFFISSAGHCSHWDLHFTEV